MRILAIDPASNEAKTSTTGIVLLDNTDLVDFWVLDYGTESFQEWWKETGRKLKYDVCVVEKFVSRGNEYAVDSSVKEVIRVIRKRIPKAELMQNAGYKFTVNDELLLALKLWKFKKTSHHQDVRAAARLGLYYAVMNDCKKVVFDIGQKVSKLLKKELLDD
jgi:hypothetical protein